MTYAKISQVTRWAEDAFKNPSESLGYKYGIFLDRVLFEAFLKTNIETYTPDGKRVFVGYKKVTDNVYKLYCFDESDIPSKQ
jgi:hypothetical protein